MARNIYNSLNQIIRRIIEFMTSKYLILGPTSVAFGIAILIWLASFKTYNITLYFLLVVSMILLGIGIYFIKAGLEQGKEYDKKVEVERLRISTLMDNLPTTLSIAVRKGIEQTGLQSDIRELNQSIKDLPNEIGKAVSDAVSKTIDMNKFKEAMKAALREDRDEQRKEQIKHDGEW
jgi:hypothetical protein